MNTRQQGGSGVSVQCVRWPERIYFIELLRPWKLATFGIGMAWLLYGAINYGIADWDVGISLIMGGLTYVCAPWSVSRIINAVYRRPAGWILQVVVALVVAWLVVDSVYWVYHTAMGNRMFRLENLRASSALYFLAGAFWLYQGSVREFLRNVVSLKKGGA